MTHPSLRLAGVSFCFMARGKAHRVLENTQRKAENYIMIYQQIYQTSPNEIAYCEKKTRNGDRRAAERWLVLVKHYFVA